MSSVTQSFLRNVTPLVGHTMRALSVCMALVSQEALCTTLTSQLPSIAGESEAFPTPLSIRKQVRFWEGIFRTYPSTTALIHDVRSPETIVDIIDFAKGRLCSTCSASPSRKERERIALRFLERYQRGIERFARLKTRAQDFSGIERRLYEVYSKDPGLLQTLYSGRAKLRIQTGLADEFVTAAPRAQAHFSYMERIFLEHKVPTVITRLPFVESMFNTKAQSKVGASGLWQFMPQTAKRFILLTPIVDERNSPMKATRAAAKLLSENFQELGSWPLAITAYNHGSIGLTKAIRFVGSRDIGRIVESYESPSFGFASRNFYAEFLAAARSFSELQRHGKVKEAQPLPMNDMITLPRDMSAEDLEQNTGLSPKILSEYNPCLLPEAFNENSKHQLPKGYQIHLPRHLIDHARAHLNDAPRTKYARR